MAFRFGGRRLFDRALLGAPGTQIRGYCQQVSSTSKVPVHRVILFFAGAGSTLAFAHYVNQIHRLKRKAKND